jgi:uncharacterized protein (DUF2249 family)
MAKHRGKHYRRGKRHLYTEEQRKEFKERYGKRGDAVWGATINKVKQEQAAARKRR